MLFLKYFVLIFNLLFFLVSLLASLHIFSQSCFFLFFMCVGSFSLEQDKHLEKHYTLLQGVGNFSFEQNHNATKSRWVWNNKTWWKNTAKLENFSTEFLNSFNVLFLFFYFFCFLFFFSSSFHVYAFFFAFLLLCLLFWFIFQFIYFLFFKISQFVCFLSLYIYVCVCVYCFLLIKTLKSLLTNACLYLWIRLCEITKDESMINVIQLHIYHR
jgi:hypothetical protein